MDVQAAVVTEPGASISILDVDLDPPREDEVLVRIHAAGVCHTDISAASGRLNVPMPVVLGHEGAGVVVETGRGVTSVAPGDHVLLAPGYCGACRQCRTGRTTYCEDTNTLIFGSTRADGTPKARIGGAPVRAGFFGQSSFAEYALVSEQSVLPVNSALPFSELAALPCGFSTGAGAVLNTLKPVPGSSIAILGVGTVGLAAIMTAKLIGVQNIIAVDRHAPRLDLATSLGANHKVITNDNESLAEQLKECIPAGLTHAFDTTGVPHLIAAAVDALGTGGVCGFVAGSGATIELDLGPMLVKGARLQGIMGGDASGVVSLGDLVKLYELGLFPIQRLVSEFPLDQIDEAFDALRSGSVIKPVIVMNRR